jgi:hypothetical protein
LLFAFAFSAKILLPLVFFLNGSSHRGGSHIVVFERAYILICERTYRAAAARRLVAPFASMHAIEDLLSFGISAAAMGNGGARRMAVRIQRTALRVDMLPLAVERLTLGIADVIAVVLGGHEVSGTSNFE